MKGCASRTFSIHDASNKSTSDRKADCEAIAEPIAEVVTVKEKDSSDNFEEKFRTQ